MWSSDQGTCYHGSGGKTWNSGTKITSLGIEMCWGLGNDGLFGAWIIVGNVVIVEGMEHED